MLIECGSECYHSDHPDRLPLITAVVAPGLLILFGYIVAFISFKRGKNEFDGCPHVFVALWLLVLAACAVFTAWNAYNMIEDDLADDSVIYDDMVCIVYQD